jgi:hypothetical protein
MCLAFDKVAQWKLDDVSSLSKRTKRSMIASDKQHAWIFLRDQVTVRRHSSRNEDHLPYRILSAHQDNTFSPKKYRFNCNSKSIDSFGFYSESKQWRLDLVSRFVMQLG